jgi:hypothetical protein
MKLMQRRLYNRSLGTCEACGSIRKEADDEERKRKKR